MASKLASSGMELKVVTEALADSYQGANALVGEASDFYNWANNGLMQEVVKLNEMWKGEAGNLFVEKMSNEVKKFSEIAVALNELVKTMNSVKKTYNEGESKVQSLVGNIDVTV